MSIEKLSGQQKAQYFQRLKDQLGIKWVCSNCGTNYCQEIKPAKCYDCKSLNTIKEVDQAISDWKAEK